MKLVRIAFQILLCVSSSRLSYATKRDDNIITISSTATTPGSIRKTAALPSAVVPATATAATQSNDTVHLVILPNHKNDNNNVHPSSLAYFNPIVEHGGLKDNASVDNASRALSTSEENWIQFGDTLTGSNTALSADGSTLAVGDKYNDSNVGYVKILRKADNSWLQIGEIIEGESARDGSGWSVSLSDNGNTVAIGAPSNDGNGRDSGHVRVYSYEEKSWVQLGDDIDGESARDNSGRSLSLSDDGNIVAIGAALNDGSNGSTSGHVRVYFYKDTSWVQLGEDIDGESAVDISGVSVSLSGKGKTVAIGALSNDGNGSNSGHVRVYFYKDRSWVQLGDDIDGESARDNSGWFVSLSDDGNTVAIGALLNDGNGSNSGHVRVYFFKNTSWVQRGADIDGESAFDYSGIVSLSGNGNTVAIGASGNTGNYYYSGHVRVYSYKNKSWVQVGEDIDGESANDGSGHSVSLSKDGSILAIGSYSRVRVYARVTKPTQCQNKNDCDDDNNCTKDKCKENGTCKNKPIKRCCQTTVDCVIKFQKNTDLCVLQECYVEQGQDIGKCKGQKLKVPCDNKKKCIVGQCDQ